VTSLAVLITYYGERELLRECIASVAFQEPDEIIVYDDASEAPAVDYVPAGVKVIRGETNRGPGFGRNELMRASQSDYVHFHDADDLFDSRWCGAVRQAIAKRRPDVVFTEIRTFGERETDRVLGLRRLTDDLMRFCIRGAMLTPSGTYQRHTVLAMGGYRTDLVQSEDWEFHIRLAALRPTYEVIDEPLVLQRLRSEGRHNSAVDVWTSCYQAVEALAVELPTEYRPDLAEAAARAGSALFQIGARAEATRACALAKRLGPPAFSGRRPVYRLLARTVGPLRAETLGAAYRRIVPEPVRAQVAGRG